MTDRERLVEFLKNSKLCSYPFGDQYSDETIGKVADHLLANGVIVPPCKVGDTVYILYPQIKYIEKYYVTGIILGDKNDTIQFKGGSVFTIWDKKYDEFFGKTVFFTPEEAEKALAEREDKNEKP